MSHDALLEPVSDEEPCGPDLDETGDGDYFNYTLAAEELLPDRFFDDDSRAPFDKTTINIKQESKAIFGFLERSRDLRLLTLEARFQILSGHIEGFCENIILTGKLIDKFWKDIHPGADGDFTLRQNTLAALNSLATSVLPLQFASIVKDKRFGDVIFREYTDALGETAPVDPDKIKDAGAITNALSNEENQDKVSRVYGLLLEAKASLSAIRNKFIDEAGFDFAPNFDDIEKGLAGVAGLIEKARPDLVAEETEHEDLDEEIASGDGIEADGKAETPAPAAAVEPATGISSHASATAALQAVETYFSIHEPTTPALMLVHQARQLIGKSLIEALDILIPESAEQAVIALDPGQKFKLGMSRLRMLSDQIPLQPNGEDSDSQESFAATTREEAQSLMSGVEGFFRASEPSSPVPMLLQKARGFVNRDFSSIINDLIVKQQQPPSGDQD